MMSVRADVRDVLANRSGDRSRIRTWAGAIGIDDVDRVPVATILLGAILLERHLEGDVSAMPVDPALEGSHFRHSPSGARRA